ncbi:MAG: hypothetical protein K0M54_09175 [Pseudomonas sp.]|uniref:hypothetical protein n=1 Tax=Pseudomonas sp. TaxID=306 RepID=UPI0025DAF3F3|nr:hypothetical protein [Pseudomonas sp.]MBW8353994.1 hypothetical protein [Pseudomonas sp.]
MKIEDIFIDVFVGGSSWKGTSCQQDESGVSGKYGEDVIRLRPVAWMWLYLGEHVTTDKIRAEELLLMGESIKPLYSIVEGACPRFNQGHDFKWGD